MIRYGLSKQDGRILFEPQEEQSSILLMTFDQFQKEKSIRIISSWKKHPYSTLL